jgi:hypothetical protein
VSLFHEKDLLLCRMKREGRNNLIIAVPLKLALRVRSVFKHFMRQYEECMMEVT